jgi:DNA-binding IclR family transcriptional regulator
VLEKLAAELHEGASFYVCEDDKRICLHRVDSTRAIRDSVHIGDRLPLTVGAAGHVLRAFNGARGERFDEIRRAMYAASFGERDTETAAVAAPVFGTDNRLMGALSVSGPRYRLEEAGEARIVPVLFKYAKELTRTCGGNIDDPTLTGWNLPETPRKRTAAKAKTRAA